MNRRTFEILSKYISHSNGAKISFDAQGDEANVNMKTGEIHLPDKIGDRNVFAVLALLMHESAHIKHSSPIIDNMVEEGKPIEQHIINCIEDIRIDKKNFRKLSNIKSFYDRLMKDHCDYSKNDNPNIQFQIKVLINAMMRLEGFHQYRFQKDLAVDECLEDLPIEDNIIKAMNAFEYQDWKQGKKLVEEIKKLLNMADQNQQKYRQKAGQDPGQGPQGQGQGKGDPLAGIEGMLKPGGLFGDKGASLSGPSASALGEVALEEQTVNQFKELLNIKERKVVEDGTILDTDNLIAYLTGEIEELFKDDAYIKCKKSKILFLLDASGSMNEFLLDKKRRFQVVGKCVERLTRILKEVQETEGINVDWDIAQFESSGMEMLDKQDWRQDYHSGGGTDLRYAFEQAVEHLEKDFTVDGKKLIIVLTDGDVSLDQIEGMKKCIIHHNTNVRSLVIGVGTDPAGHMALEILGDNLILAEENANEILLETIRSLL